MNQVSLVKEKAPFVRRKDSVTFMLLDVIIALAPIIIFAFVIDPLNALKVVGVSIITMLLAETIFVWIKHFPKKDALDRRSFIEKTKAAFASWQMHNLLAPILSALIFALCMPGAAPWWSVMLSALFGIVVAKLIFGGLGQNIFNPAAAGRVFFAICFSSTVSTYSNGLTEADVATSGTALSVLSSNPTDISNYSLLDLFLGLVPGALGEVSAILIIIGALYLFIRRAADFRATLSMVVTFFVLMLFAGLALNLNPNYENVNVLEYATYHLLSGGLLFGAVFMITDPVTSPGTKVGRITFGALVALTTSIMRLYGSYPEGVAFSILICNILVPLLDSPKIASNKYKWQQVLIFVGILAIFVAIEFAVLSGKFSSTSTSTDVSTDGSTDGSTSTDTSTDGSTNASQAAIMLVKTILGLIT